MAYETSKQSRENGRVVNVATVLTVLLFLVEILIEILKNK